MDIQKALSNNGQKLDNLIEAIISSALGDTAPTTADGNVDEIFARLEAAAQAGDRQIFQQLVAAEPETRQEESPTLLMSAVMSGKTEIVRELVAAGADVNAKVVQIFKFDALYFAVDKEYVDIVKILVDAGVSLSHYQPLESPLAKVIEKENIELIQILLDGGAKIVFDTGYNLLVQSASKINNPEVFQLLINFGCDPNATDSMGDTALVNACLHAHDAVVCVLLSAGADPNRSHKNGIVPLTAVYAVPGMAEALGFSGDPATMRSRMLTIFQALVESKADLEVRDWQGKTPLMLAADAGYFDLAQVLVANGAVINAVEDPSLGKIPDFLKNMASSIAKIAENSERKTALLYATEKGHAEIVKLLLDAGADVGITGKDDRTALQIAIQEGYTEIIELLERGGARSPIEATQSSPEALLGAAKKGNLDVLRSALQAGINPNTSELEKNRNPRHKTALMFAAERGHLEAVQMLVKAGAEVNLSDRPGKKLGKTPLMYAARADKADIVRFLLEAGAIVDAQNKRGETALLYAVEESSVAAVRILLEFGADPHKKNWDSTPFESATYAGEEIAKLMMAADRQKGKALSHPAQEEMLRSATFSENIDLVRSLIESGVSVNAIDASGWTALMYAAAKGNLELVEVLLEAGADVNPANNSGKTPLTEAAYWGHDKVVERLIVAGADVNAIGSDDDWTPLMKCLAFNKPDVAQVLLKAGADPNIRNSDGKTALTLAVEDKKNAIAQLLREAGAIE
jgi:uncharacterized protein